MTDFERWQLALAVVGAAVNLLLFAFVIVQVRLLRRQVVDAGDAVRMDHDRRKKESTLDFYAGTIDKRSSFREALPNDRDAQAISDLITPLIEQASNSTSNRMVAEYLNYLELLAVGVNLDIYDFETINRLAGGRIIAVANNYAPWIEHRRATLNAPMMWSDLSLLAARLSERPLQASKG